MNKNANLLLQGFDHVPGDDIRPVGLTGVNLDACPTGDRLVEFGVDLQQSIGADIRCEEYLCPVRRCGDNTAHTL